MSALIQDLKAKMLQSTELLRQIASDRSRRAGRSPDTEHDYLRLGQSLLTRAKAAQGGLVGVVSDTRRPTTFQKRISALRFTLQQRQLELLGSIIEPVSDEQAQRLIAAFEEQIGHVQALIELRRRGVRGPRALRNSKRRALSGLPADWRVQLCKRGRAGRYRAALLVAALTGCRPSELEKGIKVWLTRDATTGQTHIYLEIAGAKVNREQGQPRRRLTFAMDDPHPLVSMLKELLPDKAGAPVVIHIESAMNFSAEVQRLAACLWPSHRHTVTAYCFRHQWAADAKRNGDAEAVSRGLGHLSSKTQRVYGTASQGRPPHALKPSTIEADRSIKGSAADVVPPDPDEPESAS